MSARLKAKLASLKSENRAGFVPFIMAGDPDITTSAAILAELPQHGADIIEIGVPFSDPMADGPTIQAAAIRALAAGTKIAQIFDMVREFRTRNTDTPIILMGYYNPILHRGVENFMQQAASAGVDALIIVDLPTEELSAILPSTQQHGIDIICLVAPTSLQDRLPLITAHATGFLYYITIKGITGTASADYTALEQDIAIIRKQSALPIAVGFGIKSPADVATVSCFADLVVVGSAIVSIVASHAQGERDMLVQEVLSHCEALASGIQPR